MASARREKGGLVDEIGEIRSDHARRRGRDPSEVDVVGQRHAAYVHREDPLPS
jgi:hypothetical protein